MSDEFANLLRKTAVDLGWMDLLGDTEAGR